MAERTATGAVGAAVAFVRVPCYHRTHEAGANSRAPTRWQVLLGDRPPSRLLEVDGRLPCPEAQVGAESQPAESRAPLRLGRDSRVLRCRSFLRCVSSSVWLQWRELVEGDRAWRHRAAREGDRSLHNTQILQAAPRSRRPATAVLRGVWSRELAWSAAGVGVAPSEREEGRPPHGERRSALPELPQPDGKLSSQEPAIGGGVMVARHTLDVKVGVRVPAPEPLYPVFILARLPRVAAPSPGGMVTNRAAKRGERGRATPRHG